VDPSGKNYDYTMRWIEFGWPIAVAEPGPRGELLYVGGIVVIGAGETVVLVGDKIPGIIDGVKNIFNGGSSNTPNHDPRSLWDKTKDFFRGNKGKSNLEKREKLLNAVDNQKLKNAINEIYRPGAKIGDGGLADAIRHELSSGNMVGGKSHIIKGFERIRNLENIINTQTLSPEEIRIATEILNDLQDALKGVSK